VSLGIILILQVIFVVVALLIGQGIIVFFPLELILPIMIPMTNILSHLDYGNVWVFLTLASAIICAPLLAHYLARSILGLPVWQVLLILLGVPILMGLGLFYALPIIEPNNTLWVLITKENVIYALRGNHVALFGSLALLLVSLASSKQLQLAFADLMPSRVRGRIRRLRGILSGQSLLLMMLVIFYLFVAGYGFYFLSGFFLVLVTLTLLWVSLNILYNSIINFR
jgi:hypothetical protein